MTVQTDKKAKTKTPYIRKGNYIFFGSYPQDMVTDETLASILSEKVTIPPSPSDKKWTSYKYFSEGKRRDFAWYTELLYNGEKYRGVFFNAYRPHLTTTEASDKARQENNIYNLSTIYWFKYEPIKWRVLEEENGMVLILSERVIDIGKYFHGDHERIINGKKIYPNNYAYSNIRFFLNNVFYETAFTPQEKELITLSKVANDAISTNPNDNPNYYLGGKNNYICENTLDHVFLLSEQDVTTSAFGFDPDCSSFDPARQKDPTLYALCQGASVDTPIENEYNPAAKVQNSPKNGEFIHKEYENTKIRINPSNKPQDEISNIIKGNSWWWLRSPHYDINFHVRGITAEGYADYYFYYILNALGGIVPALRLKLK